MWSAIGIVGAYFSITDRLLSAKNSAEALKADYVDKSLDTILCHRKAGISRRFVVRDHIDNEVLTLSFIAIVFY